MTRVDDWLAAQPAAIRKALKAHPQIHPAYKARIPDWPDGGRRVIPNLTITWSGNTLRIQPEPPSANTIKRWLYHPKGKHQYAAYRRLLTDALAGSPTFPGRIRLHQAWRVTQRRDEDSFGLSLKPVLDALESAGVIENDKWVTLERPMQHAGGKGVQQDRGLTLTFQPE